MNPGKYPRLPCQEMKLLKLTEKVWFTDTAYFDQTSWPECGNVSLNIQKTRHTHYRNHLSRSLIVEKFTGNPRRRSIQSPPLHSHTSVISASRSQPQPLRPKPGQQRKIPLSGFRGKWEQICRPPASLRMRMTALQRDKIRFALCEWSAEHSGMS